MLARKRVLGDYHVGKTIGQGAFSKVKLGYHKETGQKVAIKIIDKKQVAAKAAKARKTQEDRERRQRRANGDDRHPQRSPTQKEPTTNGTGPVPSTADHNKTPAVAAAAADGKPKESTPAFVSQLQLEVQLLMRLDHPNVIRLYQVMETEDECFVVMEYAQGGELIEYIASRGHLTEKEARRCFRQIISAMDHCHMANVVHRDLKLENLLLNAERNILISDFGLGRTFQNDSEELMKTFCGTPNYAAVELISGIPYVGVKSDIWAMGVVLYVMMTGHPPFIGENISALYSKIKAVDYRCPDYFSQPLRDLLKKILMKDPKKRIDMDGLRSDPWVNFEEPEPPLRIMPKLMGSADASQIGQFISGITYDQTFVIYTIRRHTRDGNSVYASGAVSKVSDAQKKELTRRKSLSFQGAPTVGNQALTLSRQKSPPLLMTDTVPEEEAGESKDDAVSPLPLTSSPAVPRTLPRRRRMSLEANGGHVNGPTPQTGAIPALLPQRQRRNTVTAIQPIDDHSKKDPIPLEVDLLKRGRSLSGTPEGGFMNGLRGRRRGSLQPAGMPSTSLPADRETTVFRRMSMVSPAVDAESDPVIGPRRGSMVPVSTFSTTIRSSRTSAAEDPDIMVFTDPLREALFPEADDDSDDEIMDTELPDSSITAVEPSEKEIEDWHMLHRPPKSIRSVRFAFNSATTSTQPPVAIFQEVHRGLLELARHHDNRLTWKRIPEYYMLHCKLSSPNPDDSVEFEVEVCKVWLLKLHGVRIKRLSGSAFVFRDVYAELISSLNL
ncbi:Map microtubule affinity-regulating kinase [Gaertneriomyces sp. JEL0708]|nr:Map microtubule affinity-regulating kinase [Gaertneriomyces sp. JEL0708]